MSAIPSNLSRVPNLLSSQLLLNSITGTNTSLLELQNQLSTFKRVNRPSDDVVAASLIAALDGGMERDDQRVRNLQHASSVFGTIDQLLGEINDLVLESKDIASSNIGVTSDPEIRESQAVVVDQIIESLFASINQRFGDTYLFAGGRTGTSPIERFHGGFRYTGDREGLYTDLGPGIDFPITVGADLAIGALSARVEGDIDLNPVLTAATFVRDLRGPLGDVESRLGTVQITIDDSVTPQTISVDLSNAETVEDVANTIESAIREADPGALGGAYPAGVTLAGEKLQINVAAPYTISFADGPVGEVASALGLDNFSFTSGTTINSNPGTNLDPVVTERTLLADMNPGTPLTYGDLIIRNGPLVGTVTINAGMSVGELKEAIARLDLGVRLEIDESGDSFNVVNEVSGLSLSVEESGGGLVATNLGIRSMRATTLISDFNNGRGVQIADGAIDPLTGLPDPDRNVDFEVTLSDGFVFQVDLRPGDMQSVATVLARINAEAATAGLTIGTGPGEFQADLAPNGNGIRLLDDRGGANSIQVKKLNGFAAEDLGLLAAKTSGGPPATLVGEDRATVRVDSLFTTLIELSDSLRGDDDRGITFAGEYLEADLDRLISSRALVGGRAAQIEGTQRRLENTMLLDQQIKSSIQDLDLAEAASRFSLLQVQLQAGLQTAASIQPLNLLNFLG